MQENLAEGGEFVVSADTGEQIVAEVAAQPGEGSAHRGLTEPDALPGARDVALLQQGTQSDDEVEVEAGQIHEISPCGKALTRKE
ncbi:hypothetical protein GCM10010392_61020 [Streptomyces clavifer]|nr:hypothetical protein GCM10010392_61020 [Streptomyces clavifer]